MQPFTVAADRTTTPQGYGTARFGVTDEQGSQLTVTLPGCYLDETLPFNLLSVSQLLEAGTISNPDFNRRELPFLDCPDFMDAEPRTRTVPMSSEGGLYIQPQAHPTATTCCADQLRRPAAAGYESDRNQCKCSQVFVARSTGSLCDRVCADTAHSTGTHSVLSTWTCLLTDLDLFPAIHSVSNIVHRAPRHAFGLTFIGPTGASTATLRGSRTTPSACSRRPLLTSY